MFPPVDAPPTDDRDDTELIAAINAGDANAFEVLYHRHRDWVARLARRFTGNDADALDVLQTTFIYLFRKFPGFTLTASLRTLLWTVVRSESLALRRKRARSLALTDEHLDVPANPRGAGDVADLLVTLSPAHRYVVLMRFVDDLTIDEIAAALGIPAGTVKSRLHHAIAALRRAGI